VRTRRDLLLGLVLGAADLLIGLGISFVLGQVDAERAVRQRDFVFPVAILFALCLLLGALAVVVIGCPWYLAGRAFPSLYNRLGWLLPVLAMAPWIIAPLCVTVFLIVMRH
jgi:hypothetical protein